MDDWDESDEEIAPAPSVPTLAAPAAPLVKRASKWEGEDEEESGSDDWDASEDDTPKPTATTTAPPKKKMSLKQKLAEKERLAALGVGKEDEGDNLIDYMTPQEHKRLARQAELDADAEAAADLIGGVNLEESIHSAAPKELSNLLAIQPKTKPDLDALSKELMSTIIARHESNPLYAYFVETFAKDLSESLASKDVRKVASGLTVLGNTKQAEERDKASGKKKTTNKPKLGAAKALAVGKADTTLYDDALDDDDFM